MPRPTGPEPDILALCLAGATAFEIWDSWNFRSDFPKIAAPEDLSQSVRTILADSAARARARAQRLADQEPTEISGGSEITGGGKRRKKSEKKSKSKSNNNRSTDLCENPKCLTHVPSGGIPRPIPLPVFYMNEDAKALAEYVRTDVPETDPADHHRGCSCKSNLPPTRALVRIPHVLRTDRPDPEDREDELNFPLDERSRRQLRIPAGAAIAGLGRLSNEHEGWQCQFLPSGRRTICGTLCETAREVLDHYSKNHRSVNVLLPSYWHPCRRCDAFNRDYEKCLACGDRVTYTTERWVCGITGYKPAAPAHKTVGLGILEDAAAAAEEGGGDEGIFGRVSHQQYTNLGFAGLLQGVLRPVYNLDGFFTATFYSSLRVLLEPVADRYPRRDWNAPPTFPGALNTPDYWPGV